MIKYFSFLLAIFFVITSCKKEDDPLTLVDSSGRINHLLVVIKNSELDGKIGDTLAAILSKPLPGLPQEEAPFTVSHVTPDNFTKLFRNSRNILFVGVGDKDEYYTNNNVYAYPQNTVTIIGKDTASLIENIKKHEKEFIHFFKKNDLALYQNKITKKHWNPDKIKTFNDIGFSMKIPKTYAKVEDDGAFLWYRYPYTKGQLDIIAYEIPVKSAAEFNVSNILKIRDSIGQKYIPGQFENTYMTTETQIKPTVKKIKLAGMDAIETRGLWFVKNDFMGGPFISYALYDKKNSRMIIIEGFVYSPPTKKRDFVFELESILKTVEVN